MLARGRWLILILGVALTTLALVACGDDEEEEVARPTATVETEAIATSTPVAANSIARVTPTPRPEPTATPRGFPEPDDALASVAHGYIGPCPEITPGEPPPSGECSIELHRGEELATFNICRVGTDCRGEAVLTRNEDGTWSLHFLESPRLDMHIGVGSDAMVFQAGDCLNFREAPSLSAAVVSCQIDGTRAQVMEGPVEAEGHTWWRMEGLGWATSQFLAPAAE